MEKRAVIQEGLTPPDHTESEAQKNQSQIMKALKVAEEASSRLAAHPTKSLSDTVVKKLLTDFSPQ